jgi:hypothetical protein
MKVQERALPRAEVPDGQDRVVWSLAVSAQREAHSTAPPVSAAVPTIW